MMRALRPGFRRSLKPHRPASTLSADTSHLSAASADCIALEHKRNGLKCTPLPLVLARGFGARLWDVEGREYVDFFGGRGALILGHSHPRVVTALASQAATLSVTSREFHHAGLGVFADRLARTFGYDVSVPLTTDGESRDIAVKIARRWAYRHKNVARNKAVVVRSAAAARSPRGTGFKFVEFGDLKALSKAMSSPNAAAFVTEPILNEGGAELPPTGYLRAAAEVCKKNGALFIVEENQTGLGRTGKPLCVDHDTVRPDVVTLGNALGGGLFPMAAVMGREEVMRLLPQGERTSTFSGSPLACAVATEALSVVEDEKLAEGASEMGELIRSRLGNLTKSNHLQDVRGMGLFNVVETPGDLKGNVAGDICLSMAQQGVLAERISASVIRFTPPLIISQPELSQALDIVQDAVKNVVDSARK